MTRPEFEAKRRTELTGVLWKPLCIDGIEPIYLISENRQIYNFIRCRLLTLREGRYVRFPRYGKRCFFSSMS